jgi:PmbA protein
VSTLQPELEKLTSFILDQAKQKGAQQAEVIYQNGRSLSIKAEGGQLGEYKVSSSEVFGVRLFHENKVAISYSEERNPESLKAMIDQAWQTLPYLEVEPTEILTCSTQCVSPKLSADSSNESHIEQKIQKALELESSMLKEDKRISSVPYSGLSESEGMKVIRNSLGGLGIESYQSASTYTSALMKEGDKNAMYYTSRVARNFKELSFDDFNAECVQKTSLLLDGKSIPSGSYEVIFSPDLQSTFIQTFFRIFSAKALIEGVNPMKGKLGEMIAHPELTLVDSPQASFALNPQYFDDEGFKTQDLVLIGSGQYLGLLQNSSTAKKLNMPHSANASRTPKSALGISSSYLEIKGGSTSDKSIQEQGEVLEIFDMQGLHSGANATSGLFSFAASGRLWKNGEMIQAVRSITISGNFYQALKDIVAIGDKSYLNSSKSFQAPIIRFGGLHVAGA